MKEYRIATSDCRIYPNTDTVIMTVEDEEEVQ